MEPGAPRGRGWRKLISIATGIAAGCGLAGIASASDGGGIGTPDPPEVRDVLCLERCAGVRIAAEGSRIQLSGRNLGSVERVRFAAHGGGRVGVDPTKVAATTVEAKVPESAATGTVIVSAYGLQSETRRDRPLEIVAADEIPKPGDFRLVSAEASPRKSFYDGVRRPQVAYLFEGGSAVDVRVEVMNRESKATVATIFQRDVEPNVRHIARWDGLTARGRPAPNGDYRFRVGNAAGSKTTSTRASAFGYHLYRFPLDAHHTYGDGYGAGRNHEGQDVFAKCGTPIQAARGGRVQANDTHPAAGNYLVVDGKGTKLDTFYAHMARRSPLRRGARVHTGEVIGRVGQTGNASGCHLHFEIWSAPGWYEGGNAMPSVGRLLHTWDSWS